MTSAKNLHEINAIFGKRSHCAMITRFAPSPTGYLHVGHALAAKQAFGFARAHDGVCLLRIEDIDQTRCRPKYTDAIYRDLAWLGFEWPSQTRVQSEHLPDYAGVLETLKSRGLVYPCFLTRRELAGKDMPYSGGDTLISEEDAKVRIAGGEAPAWRLSMRAAKAELGERFDTLKYSEKGKAVDADPARHGDVVLARKDIGTSYHIACTHDDALQGVTDVVRGQDLEDLTGLHVLIQTLMGWPVPRYHHHRLVMKDDTHKLSKRNGDTAVATLRTAGLTPAQVLELAQNDI